MRTVLAILLSAAMHCVALALFLAARPGAALAVLAATHALILYGTLFPCSTLFGPLQHRRDDADSGVWITIDDGPDPRTTPPLLAALERHGMRAAFFLIGERAARHPELVRAIQNAGHIIGNHSHTHPAGRFWCIGPWAARREIRRCDAVIHAITGSVPDLFRSPAGHSNPFVRLAVARAGKTLVAWSARGFDGVDTPKEKVLARLQARLTPRAIVVLHEGYDPVRRGYSPAEILDGIAARATSIQQVTRPL